MESSYTIVQKENEYRVLLAPANLSSLSVTVLKEITNRDIDVSELIIELVEIILRHRMCCMT